MRNHLHDALDVDLGGDSPCAACRYPFLVAFLARQALQQ